MTKTGSLPALAPTPLVPTAVVLRGLHKSFNQRVILPKLDLTIEQGEFFSLLGPSGCGKTTLLRLIAGLDQPDAGEIWVQGQRVDGQPAHQRPINTVFQRYALFPHLTVSENVAFGLKMRKIPAATIQTKVAQILELVEIGTLAQRKPQELSGGQQQRVALARALVNEPTVLLLDEPLAALDAQLRKQLQGELRRLQRRLGLTFIFVTHDQAEALVLSDRIAVMREGQIEQVGTPVALYEQPRTLFVANFLGTSNVIPVTGYRAGQAQTPLGPLQVARGSGHLVIRPERLRLLSQPEPTLPNQYPVTVLDRVYTGSQRHYTLGTAEGFQLELWLTQDYPAAHGFIHLPAEHLVWVDA